MACVSLWLVLLSIMPSGFTHVLSNSSIFFFYGWIIFYSVCICMCITFRYPFIHCWILRLFPYIGYCGCAARDIGVHISFQVNVFISFRKIPRSETAGSYVLLFLIFWGTSILFFRSYKNLAPLGQLLIEQWRTYSAWKIEWLTQGCLVNKESKARSPRSPDG